MYPSINFIVANIFLSRMTAGEVCRAIAVYILSNSEQANRLNDYAKEMCKGYKK